MRSEEAAGDKDKQMMKIAIIGSGLIGRAWAVVFAHAGHQVVMQDTDEACLDKLADTVMQEAEILYRHGLLADPQSVREKLTITSDLNSALTGADFIQENGPERNEIKRSLFEALDQLAPSEIPIASSTSAIIASQFTENLSGRHRCFVGHPVNPPHLVPLVELCGSPWTSSAILDQAHRIYAECGMVPVRIKSEK